MPMTIPSVVSAPRTLLAQSARKAMRNDSPTIDSDLIARPLLPARAALLGLLGLLVVVDPHHRAVVEVLGDRAVAAGNDLFALRETLEDLDPLVALDPGLHLAGDRLAALDAEHDLDEAVAIGLEALLRVLALLALAHELVDGAERDALDRHAECARVGVRH